MVDLERAVEVGLVTVFIARLITVEHGPFDIFTRFQSWVQLLPKWADEFKALVACPICLSVWVSLIGVLLLGDSLIEWPIACALAWFFGGLGGWGSNR